MKIQLLIKLADFALCQDYSTFDVFLSLGLVFWTLTF